MIVSTSVRLLNATASCLLGNTPITVNEKRWEQDSKDGDYLPD